MDISNAFQQKHLNGLHHYTFPVANDEAKLSTLLDIFEHIFENGPVSTAWSSSPTGNAPLPWLPPCKSAISPWTYCTVT
jgi:hypothetical protein